LIYKVIKFAIITKYPRCRSALIHLLWRWASFSYWLW
jgi:hypothetical protein